MSDDKPAFDPSAPFEPVAEKPAFDPSQPFSAEATPAAAPQNGGLLNAAKEGGKGLLRGAAGFAGDLGEAVMGPFGPSHHLANLKADLGFGEQPAPEPGYGQQIAQAAGIEPDHTAGTAGRYAGSVGEFLGNPSTYFGPGGWLSKTLMGAASGAGSEAAGQAAEGSKYEGLARMAGAFAAGPAAGRLVKPQVAPAQQRLLDAGVTQMTPGQLAGGLGKSTEDLITSIPILGSFVKNARGRSVESFNRAVADQALEPIGQTVPRNVAAGHDLVDHVQTQLSNAYDQVKPHLTFMPDRQFAYDLSTIRTDMSLAAQPQIDQFQRIVDNKLGPNRWDRTFQPPGSGPVRAMSGEQFKKIEGEFTKLAKDYNSSTDASQRTLGNALSDLVSSMRQSLERSNPVYAPRLAEINRGYAMFTRMQGAAGNRTTSQGVFMPSDLLSAIKRGDSSVRKGAFARGDALMQRFAEAGQEVLPSKMPTSGTAERAATMGLIGGGGYLHPGLAAAGTAAIAPYLRPSMYMLNRYVAPTTGARASYANTGRGAGALRPLLQTDPFGANGNPYGR